MLRVPTFLSLPSSDVICDLLLKRCTTTWDLFFSILNSAIIVTKKKYKKEKNKDYYFRRGKRGKVQMSTRMCQGTTCIFLQEQKKMQGENVIAVITTNRNRLKKNLMTQSTKVFPFKRFKRQGILSLKKG